MSRTVNQKVLVTGGSSGIGLALARLLAVQGNQLFLIARNQSKLNQAVDSLRASGAASGSTAYAMSADITDYETLQPVLADLVEQHGVPDLIINCAGFAKPGLFTDLPIESFRSMMETNYFGSLNTTKFLLPFLLERNRGHIVFVSSVAGYMAIVGYTGYSPSKFALRGFSDALRTELNTTAIRLSLVFPPDTDTPGLQAEKAFQPPLLQAMSENAPALPAETVAKSILAGIQRNRYIITPGFESTLYFKLVGLLGGGLMYPLIDWFLADARRRIARNPLKYRQADK